MDHPPTLPRTSVRALPGPSLLSCTLLFLAVACTGGSSADAPVPADLVLLNGKVITVDAEDRVAQAVAVRGGKVVGVG